MNPLLQIQLDRQHNAPLAAAAVRPLDAGPRRILVVDDDTMVAAALAAVLASEGYEAMTATAADEAIAKAAAHPPGVVLLDLNLRGTDGWQVLKRLDRLCPLVPVIVITARPDQYASAVRMGADAFMEKPLDVPLLLATIDRLLSEGRDRHVTRITHRDFRTELLTPAAGCLPFPARTLP